MLVQNTKDITEKMIPEIGSYMKDSINDWTIQPVSNFASLLSFGPDFDKVRDKTRSELKREGYSEEEIDEIRYKSMDWFYSSDRRLNDKEKAWKELELAKAQAFSWQAKKTEDDWRRIFKTFDKYGLEYKIEDMNKFQVWFSGIPSAIVDERKERKANIDYWNAYFKKEDQGQIKWLYEPEMPESFIRPEFSKLWPWIYGE